MLGFAIGRPNLQLLEFLVGWALPTTGSIAEVALVVGWVEVTKPFGYAQGNAQQAKRFSVGFRYRSTQTTIIYNTFAISIPVVSE